MKHFALKALALCFLVIAELPERLYERIGIDDDLAISLIRLILIIAAVLLAFEFFRRYRRKLIRNLLEVISSVIFSNKATDGIYKITCYKYAGPFYCFCLYRLRNFCMVLFRRERKKKRKMSKWSKGYLVCYERHIWENNTSANRKTSIAFLVDGQYTKGFAGKVLRSPQKHERAVDVGQVNEIVAKLKADQTLVDAFENEKYKNAFVQTGITKLKEIVDKNQGQLTRHEATVLERFMSGTNTNLFELMTIGNGVHANHFLGFKVYRNLYDYEHNRTPWGVVTIDARDSRPFQELCIDSKVNIGTGNDELWLDVILETFTAIFSGVLD